VDAACEPQHRQDLFRMGVNSKCAISHPAGLQSLGTDPAAPLPPGTLPEALPEARIAVLLQNLGIAPNSVVVSAPCV
jgi:hypothetical protein